MLSTRESNYKAVLIKLSYRIWSRKWIVTLLGWAVTCLPMKREVRGWNLGTIKSDTVLPTARHRWAELHAGAMTRSWAPPIRYVLRRNTASVTKICFLISLKIAYSRKLTLHNSIQCADGKYENSKKFFANFECKRRRIRSVTLQLWTQEFANQKCTFT